MNQTSTKSRIVAVVLPAAVLPLLVSLAAHALLGDARRVQEPLHAAVELLGTCMALSVAMLLWLRLQREHGSPHLLWWTACTGSTAFRFSRGNDTGRRFLAGCCSAWSGCRFRGL
jgi:hypothetical protein